MNKDHFQNNNNSNNDNQQILNELIKYYHRNLKDDNKISNLIAKEFNFLKDEIESLKIGYSNNSISSVIPAVIKRKLKDMNLMKGNKEIFQACITFPVINSNDIIEDVIGIKIENNKISNSIISWNNTLNLKNRNDVIKYVKDKRIKNIGNIQEDVLTFPFGKRTYFVRGLNPNIVNKLKVNIKISQKDVFHIDTVDLYSSKLRSGLINQCCIIFDDDRETISDELNQLVQKLEEIRIKLKETNCNEKSQIVITAKEEKQIMKILKHEDLLKMINEDLGNTGIAGEETNRCMMYMIFTSRKLSQPLSAIVKGDSSSGKSYLINQVLKLFPDEDVKNFTEVSAKSLFYMPSDALEHKILVIFERHGSESSDYSIRSLQSENKLQIAVTARDPLTSEMKTTERTVRGPVSFIESTTKLNIHPENETRSFNVFIDESENQTEKIYRKQNLIYLPKEKLKIEQIKKIIWKHKTLQRLLQPIKVIIKYIEKIKFPKSQLRMRRDRMKFLSLIECFAFLYQYQREKVVIENEEYVLADIKDYEMAYNLAEKIMADTLSIIHQKSRELYGCIKKIVENRERNSFTVSDIENKIGWSSLKIRRYLKQLMEEEYVERKINGQGKKAIYSICPNKRIDNKILHGILTPEELRKII